MATELPNRIRDEMGVEREGGDASVYSDREAQCMLTGCGCARRFSDGPCECECHGTVPFEDEVDDCSGCGSEMEWMDCDACGGDGEFDEYEVNPSEHLPGDTSPCDQCDGKGGWSMCSARCGKAA